MSNTRLALETRQEHLSRDALRKRLSEYGWMANDLGRDIGHDILVHICTKGEFSGLTFLAQVKSTSNPRTSSNKDSIAYRFDVSDFEYWEASTPVNVLILWDVMADVGWWIGVEDAIKELDARLPQWRSQETVTVHFPSGNTLTDEGLKGLREVVRVRSMPLIQAGRKISLSATFSFPSDEEGLAKDREFRQMLDHGEEVKIDGHYIKNFTMSSWYERLFGAGRAQPEELVIRPVPDERPFPIHLSIPGHEQTGGEIRFIELKMTRRGRVSLQFEGSDPTGLLHVTWKVSDEDGSEFNLEYRQRPTGIRSALQALRFFRAFGIERKLTVTPLSIDAPATFELPPEALPAITVDGLVSLLEKCLVIEAQYNTTFSLPESWWPDLETEAAILEAYAACTSVVINRGSATLTVRGTRKAAQNWLKTATADTRSNSKKSQGLSVSRNRRVQIYGQALDLGRMKSESPMTGEEFVKAIRDGLASSKNSEDVAVQLRVSSVRTTYERWSSPAPEVSEPTDAELSSRASTRRRSAKR